MKRPSGLELAAFAALAIPSGASAAEPTEYEQYLLEVVNQARTNPVTEVARIVGEVSSQPGYWGTYTGFNEYVGFAGPASLNEGPPLLGPAAYTIPSSAKQPLAFNTEIMDATRSYVLLMQANNSVGHSIGGTSHEERLIRQGYDTDLPVESGQNNYFPGGENNATISTSDSFDFAAYGGDIRKEALDTMHHTLFTDPVEPSRGHRLTLMTADWREAGIALSFGTDGAFSSAYVNHVFAYQADRGPFITGIAFDDHDSNGFYTPEAGESLGSLQVTVYRTGTLVAVATTTTFASGGFGVIVPANGTYDVRFVGAGIDETVTGVAVATQNVKVDAIDPGSGGGTTSGGFEIATVSVTGSDLNITWPSVAGVQYQVYTSTNLSDWSLITGSQTNATGVLSSYTHSGAVSRAAARFYRVERIP